jgi:hypothetical protein
LKIFLFMVAVITITGSLLSQDIQVNRQNKTIAVTAEESTTADAEVALLTIGYRNYGVTQDALFRKTFERLSGLQGRCWMPGFLEQTSRPTNCN